MESRVLVFDSCRVQIYGDHVCTTFNDGYTLNATPQRHRDDHKRAYKLGYRSVEDMTREHDPLHTFLAHKMGLPFSPALYSAAHDEEGFVMAFQHYINTGLVSEKLWPLVSRGHDLTILAAKARELLRIL